MNPRKNIDGTITSGIFDDLKNNDRVKYVSGFLTHIVHKSWIEDSRVEVVDRLSEELRKHWGYYPDLPEKLK